MILPERVAPQRIPTGVLIETNTKLAMEQLASRLSAEDLATLRALIRTHEQRLQGLDPIALDAALRAAIYADVTANPLLAAALRQAAKGGILRSKRRVPQN